ncbi:ABC transporter permease [Paralcaligenes sp. KSB-10]|uniref:ABC transporter permease n=1 Tax=Paralcaligenes sp. KSB-10 TaxID=2901142 RepID=UPI001E41C351|nr:ABC transporter permease [Paralcaligenes sp. KSB-10]UHL62990.1 ABC transporter permease [Paralcaligenes sp. KSB-10]
MNKRIKFVNILSAILCLILIAPILIVVIVSFGKSSYMIFPPSSFSTKWYLDFFSSPDWMGSLVTSLIIGLVSSLIATTLGFLGAYSLVRGTYRNKKLLISFCLLPLIIPSIITAVALYFASVPLDLVGSKLWIAICHAALSIPVVLLILISSLQGVDQSIERAAYGLGASKFYTFTRIVIPLAAPGILSAAFFSFLTSFDELIISLFLSGVSSQTLPVRIWNSLLMDMEPVIAAISSFLILLTIVLLLLELAARRLRT